MIPINTPKGTFRVWTKRVGNNPRIKVLLLHGGPSVTHEYYDAFDSFFPAAGIEYYYDQLGSFYSDQPNEPDLWELPRFVEEVEQVRQALGLNRDNFYLLGSSWATATCGHRGTRRTGVRACERVCDRGALSSVAGALSRDARSNESDRRSSATVLIRRLK